MLSVNASIKSPKFLAFPIQAAQLFPISLNLAIPIVSPSLTHSPILSIFLSLASKPLFYVLSKTSSMFRYHSLLPSSPTYSTIPLKPISPLLLIKPPLIFSLKKSLRPLNKIPKPNPSSSLVVFLPIKLSVMMPKNSRLSFMVSNVISHSQNFPVTMPPWSLPPLIMKFYPASNLPTLINSTSFPVPKLNSIFFPI